MEKYCANCFRLMQEPQVEFYTELRRRSIKINYMEWRDFVNERKETTTLDIKNGQGNVLLCNNCFYMWFRPKIGHERYSLAKIVR